MNLLHRLFGSMTVPAASRRRLRRVSPRAIGVEMLESRQLLAFTPFTGRDTSDFYMRPQTKADDPVNPQWNMEKIRATDVWPVYDGNRQSVVVVMDYGVDFQHEDFGASQLVQGQLWDYGKIHSSLTNNFRFSKRGRDDFNQPVDIKKEKMPADWNELTKPKPDQFLGNHSAGIIGAKTDNKFGVAGINWDVQMYSSEVIIDDTTDHLYISQRANRLVQYLRLGIIPDVQNNPNPQLIRAVSFGYSSAKDYGDIFNQYVPVPESAPDGAGEYDFVSLGQGIQQYAGDKGQQGILVTVPTGDGNKTWPTRYYDEGQWAAWAPWETWDPAWNGVQHDSPWGPGYKPGTPDNILAVAATDIEDRPWVGNAANPIDIYAPGVGIWSVGEQASSYEQVDGTRQAQSHVAGAISLLYDVANQHGFEPTYHQVREAIIQGGDDIGLGKPRLNIVNSIKYLSILLGKNLMLRPNQFSTEVSIMGGQALEGDTATTAATFELTLTEKVPVPVTVTCTIEDGSAQVADRDYRVPVGSKVTVTIPPNTQSIRFSITVVGDRKAEGDETFRARISDVPGFVEGGLNATATWTILNDDLPPTISLRSAGAVEGSAARPGTARVMAVLSKPSPQPVTVVYSVQGGTAVAGADFIAPAGVRSVTFRPMIMQMPIDIRLVGDAAAEADEGFTVRLDSAVNANLVGGPVMVTIWDDDRILIGARAALATARTASSVNLTFTVSLSRSPTVVEGPLTVNYTTVNGTAITGVDYGGTAGTLTFNPGERTKTVVVTSLPRRPNERYPKDFTLRLSAPSANGSLGPGVLTISAIGRIS
jgi:hypothetical protein